MFAILRWSALPGASRHHWGTDIDVYDEWAVEPGYRVQLTPDECAPGGVFERLHRWLDARLAEGEYASFYRPFAMDRGGVAPEPWHLSYGPQARLIEGLRERHRYRDFLAGQPLALKEEVLANFDEIYERFVAPAAD
jgi:LAS superfamily LD-carboxypeptidase LdcB